MTAAELRAKYWRMKHLIESRGINPTLDRELALLQIELQAETAALLADQNELLNRTIGLVNMEELLLLVMKVLREKEKQCSDMRKGS
jgi:hypothetical protein